MCVCVRGWRPNEWSDRHQTWHEWERHLPAISPYEFYPGEVGLVASFVYAEKGGDLILYADGSVTENRSKVGVTLFNKNKRPSSKTVLHTA